ncbi:SusC/RagA family TonB-linked outer membrane protein [Chitinophaga qingshengii]|uniref:SusC/RagA family TonB-linked outer membrane protein n=1 Tax=Chitinophaga qingshengii TaxID=1569794 RepID=A0ABR7TQW2_9BACT|nr:SusC/RagA family TonB-linked outer membrane protein [Chitinophaga qingshengii]MBC9932866.1 SusC/RagA family TonB-linked outer membrane protein [Chitinophaga qingshengii]
MPELRHPKRYIPWKQLGLLLLVVFCLPLRGLSQTMTYSGKKVSLQQAFAEVKKQTNYAVVFNPEQVDVTLTVPVNAHNQPLDAFMKALLAKTPLSYSIVGTTIVIFRKSDMPPAFNTPPPPAEIMGVVFDEKTTQPIPGVSVFASASNKGTQTNEKGFFSLKNVKDAEILTFSSIGYEKVSMPAGQPGVSMYVRMKTATSELDQAVVQAYGVTSKRLATGNITKVSGAEIASQPVMNPLQALQGRVPGLLVTQTSGYASSPVKLEIRGRNSLGKGFLSDPLYIVDGVPLTVLDLNPSVNGVSSGFVQGGLVPTGGQSPLFGLSAKDIESIEVLKDADATAIYGSRGANGVIIITTKRGKMGKTTLSLDAKEGIVTVPRRWQLLDTRQYLQMRREAFKNDGIAPTVANAPDLMLWDTTRYTNWQKELLGTGKMTSVSASLSGGDNHNTFYVGANYGRQVEILSRSGASQKASLMSRIRHNSNNQKFSIMVGSTIGYTKVDAIQNNSNAIYLAPNAPPIFDSKGNLNYEEWNASGKATDPYPFAPLLYKSNNQTNQFDGNMEIRYEIIKGLTFSTTGGYSYVSGNNHSTQPIASQNPITNPTGMAIFGTTRNTNWIVEPQLAYSRFIGKGDLSVQAGASYQAAATNGGTIFGFGYTDDALLNSVTNAPFQQASENVARYKYAAVFGRISYNWDNKYMLNLNARRDGSSRFAPGRQYGNFGSVGLGWILSEEPWVKAVLPSWVSFLKLRGSYGITGGDGSIGDYQYLSQWSTMLNNIPLAQYGGIPPYVPIHALNQDYHWEANKKMEGALTASFLNDRINLEVAHYRNRTGDQVTGLPTPFYTGFNSVIANWPAVVQNSGWEGLLRANLIQQKDLSWSVSFNISRNHNKLVSYPGLELSPYYNVYKIGESLSSQYYLHYLGIDPLTGKHSFEDHNQDGFIDVAQSGLTTATADRYVAIDIAPKYYGGIGSQFTWKGIRLDLFFDFKKQIGADPFASIVPGTFTNIPVKALDNHWTKPGDNAKYVRYTSSGSSYLNTSDGAFTDASYLRLRSLSLSYDVSEKLIKRARMESLRLFMQTENIFTITRFPGLDPDLPNPLALPAPRTITGGVTLNF